jgi:hypothetical protein
MPAYPTPPLPGPIPVRRPISVPMQQNPIGMRGPMPGPRLALGSFKKGGKVKKTGIYKLHKGERILRAKMSLKDLK